MGHQFGGRWTELKLEVLRKYLPAYTRILARQRHLRFAYIDAFAGTGTREDGSTYPEDGLTFDDPQAEPDLREFRDGSATIALDTTPAFPRLIFIEQRRRHVDELERLCARYPDREIRVVAGNANVHLQELAAKDWRRHRAVVFLDPYGMQVDWETVQALGRTRGVDLWYLFPLGIGVNRLLTRLGDIPAEWVRTLDRTFGTRDWRDEFYAPSATPDMFGYESNIEKVATYDGIARFTLDRLGTAFEFVAPNPVYLRNSTGCPLYMLCFAASNATGWKIARDVLSSV